MPISPLLAFFLSFFALITGPLFFPELRLLFFAPYLVISLYKSPFFSCFGRALLAGVIVDLFSAGPLFGATSLNYILVLCLLFRTRRNFFEDNTTTLPLMTFLFAFSSTFLSSLLHLFFGKGFGFTPSFFINDLFLFSLCDSAYSLLLFSLPFQLIKKRVKIRS